MHTSSDTDTASETDDFWSQQGTFEKQILAEPDKHAELCGFKEFSMFKALLMYVKDDIKSVHQASKFEQLFSVLAKLHKNEDSLYLDKYIFPYSYGLIIELLYTKLKVLCKDTGQKLNLPEVFAPEFDSTQKLLITGVINVYVTDGDINIKSIKYLIGYTPFGEVIFVSNTFGAETTIQNLILFSGILDQLTKEHWIIFIDNDIINVTQVEKISIENDSLGAIEMNSDKIITYTEDVVNRIVKHYSVLNTVFPDFMLHSKGDICFLDKLVFVCCMLLNMLPRCTYN